MQWALSKSFSKTVPTGTPIASGKATEVDSWHMFELSGKLFVPYMTSEMHFPEDCIADSLAALAKHQVLNHQTHATHAAAFYVPKGNLIIREDVGRHNALDKLAGALSLRNIDPAQGAIVITSRVSVEMV